MMRSESAFESRFLDREAALALLESGYTYRTIAFILDITKNEVIAYSKGFANCAKYEEHLAKKRGFSSLVEYQELIKDPTSLIINSLMHKSPSGEEEIRRYIAENFYIRLRGGRVEKIIRGEIQRANRVMTEPLFIAHGVAYSLNTGSKIIEDFYSDEAPKEES